MHYSNDGLQRSHPATQSSEELQGCILASEVKVPSGGPSSIHATLNRTEVASRRQGQVLKARSMVLAKLPGHIPTVARRRKQPEARSAQRGLRWAAVCLYASKCLAFGSTTTIQADHKGTKHGKQDVAPPPGHRKAPAPPRIPNSSETQ